MRYRDLGLEAGERSSFTPPDHEHWIETSSGRCFDLRDPRPVDIEIEDIAAALSKMCRFNGHCRSFYSVAEHSLNVLDLIGWADADLGLWALLHDATEAYLPDVTRPLKRMWPGFKGLETHVMIAIALRFELAGQEIPSRVRELDNLALTTEARVLMTSRGAAWVRHGCEGAHPAFTPRMLSPTRAEVAFLDAYERLEAVRGQRRGAA